MQQVKSGDLVSVEYVGIINGKDIFETTADSGPLEFQVGTGAVLPSFDQAVVGMAVNEEKTITIPPNEGYGEILPDLIHTMDQERIGGDTQLKTGMILSMDFEHDGQTQKVPAQITNIANGLVTLDFNHPLAGKTLQYTITVVGIQNDG